jgi:peptide/nickel transport system permease protein
VHSFWHRFAARPIGVTSAVFVLMLVIVALGAPVLLPVDPNKISDEVLIKPFGVHWLGTDELGRDVLTSLMYGVRVSLMVGFLAALTATVIGAVVGAIAGYAGGVIDVVVMRFTETFQVVPGFILAVVIVAISGPGLLTVTAVIALLAWPQVARVLRGEVLRIKRLEYVDAVRCLGIPETKILIGEVLPNAIAPVIAVGTLIIGEAILLEAALSFLGLSSPEIVSWGKMLNSGQRFLFQAWWLSLFPGTAIFATVLAFNLLGDAIGAALNPKLRAK